MDKHLEKKETKKLVKKDSKYWRSVEDHDRDPNLLSEVEPEFMNSPTREGYEAEGESSESRRDFMKLMAASFAMFGTTACRRPAETIVSYVKKPENVTAGIANWYASSCGECEAACGVVVKTREGRPIKFEGNSDHPVNKGGLCAIGQASVLNLYDADRLQASIEAARKGISSKIGFDQIEAKISEKLKAAKSKGGKVVVLTGNLVSPTAKKLVADWTKAIGGTHVSYEPMSSEEAAIANEASYGSKTLSHVNFEKAEMIVTFGADFLGTWGNMVEASKGWVKNRKLGASNGGNKKMSELVVFESMMTLTGTNSDVRYRVRSGDEVKAALALAYELIVAQAKSKYAGDGQVKAALAPYSTSKMATELGIEASVFAHTAKELWENKGKSLVLGGGNIVKGEHGVALEVVANLLNSALENEGSTIDGSGNSEPSSVKALNGLIAEMKAGKIDALIMAKTNPVYSLPKAAGFTDALSKVGLVVDFSTHFDETAQASDYVVAANHYLEQWGDVSPRAGVYGIMQPTIAPLHATVGFEDTLLSWGKKLGLAGFANAGSYHDYLKDSWKGYQREVGDSKPFASFWDHTLRSGFAAGKTAGHTRAFNKASLSIVEKMPAITSGLKLVMYAKAGVGDGKQANNSWLQEMPDPISKVTWDNYANVSVAYAKSKGLTDGDMLKVTANGVSIEVPAHVQPGTHDDTIAIAVGYGRTAAGAVGNGVGFNVYPFASVKENVIEMSAIPVTVEKTGGKYKLAATQKHNTIDDGRPIIKEATFAEYVKKPNAGNELKDKMISLWPTHDYPGYKWAMSIDLNACTGCGSCIIGCQSENNIPVVGKKYVLESREMHWIRIDRYYSGRADNPETIHQPMLCQHCDNAPCETVCPVLATMHDHEGLNQQVYNRCVGTRYCANNCPYKVRRFNWFTFTDVAKPMNLAYNPDVTVRTRGVMEKCTFCTQRIRDAKDSAKDANRLVTDADLKTACQQSCPTDAISFGNINNKDSEVAKWTKDPRGFRVLEDLNVRPAITYMTKIRNTETGKKEADHHHS